MGFGNTMARVGGIVAPLVRMTSEYFPSLPLVIYATAPIISGLAACFLPETLNVPLPDTIQDVESRSVARDFCVLVLVGRGGAIRIRRIESHILESIMRDQ